MELITAAGKSHLTYDEALEALGVKGGESPDELKRIFRDKMRKMHAYPVSCCTFSARSAV